MRKLLSALAIGALALGSASTPLVFATHARAAVLPFQGLLSIPPLPIPALGFNNPLPPFQISGSGIATLTGSGGGAHLSTLDLPASPFSINGAVLTVTTGIVGEAHLTAHNEAGSGSLSGFVMPLNGLAKECLFTTCATPPQNLTMPLSVIGAGGSFVSNIPNHVNFTVSGAPWTTATAVVGTLTQMGFRHGPASLTSSTAQASGSIRLVTPIFVSTTLITTAAFGVLDLHFVPEPSTLLLLGSGIAGLVIFGRTKGG